VAAKLSRAVVKGLWCKIEKIITYKQKLHADQERHVYMNKQLVVLVQQTEKYTESLAQNDVTTEADSDEDDSCTDEDDEDAADDVDDSAVDTEMDEDMTSATSDSCSESASSGRRKRKRHHRRGLTIEEALAGPSSLTRRSKQKMIDYSRMKIPTNELFFGWSTASDASGSDGSYDPDNASDREDSDNDSTLQQAMQEELQERSRKDNDPVGRGSSSTFLADPEELRKLREEVHMDVEDVIGRLQQEGNDAASKVESESKIVDSTSRPGTPTIHNKAKHVSSCDGGSGNNLGMSTAFGTLFPRLLYLFTVQLVQII
jgi:hypothetical protein